MIRNLVFDAYGTLISTGNGSVEATRRIFAPYSPGQTPEEIYKRWKALHKQNMRQRTGFLTEREIFIQDLGMLFDFYHIQADPVLEVRPMLESLYHRSLFPETREVIDRLSGKYGIVIGSTTDTAPLLHTLEAEALAVSPVFTSESLRCYKPEKAFYDAILARMGWQADECCFIGDSIEDDVKGPMAAGMHAVLVDRHGRYKPESPADPFHVVSSLSELPMLN